MLFKPVSQLICCYFLNLIGVHFLFPDFDIMQSALENHCNHLLMTPERRTASPFMRLAAGAVDSGLVPFGAAPGKQIGRLNMTFAETAYFLPYNVMTVSGKSNADFENIFLLRVLDKQKERRSALHQTGSLFNCGFSAANPRVSKNSFRPPPWRRTAFGMCRRSGGGNRIFPARGRTENLF